MLEIKVIGQMDNTQDHTFESANRVYSPKGIAPTIPTSCGGGHTPYVLQASKVVGGIGEKTSNGGTQYYQQDRVLEMGDIAMCHPANIPGGSYKYLEIKEMGHIEKGSGKHQSNIVYDSEGIAPTVCAMYGVKQPPAMHVEIKALDEQNTSIHNDGTVGTLTTDGSSPKHNNRVMEIKKVGNVVGKGESQGGNTYDSNGISPSLLAGMSHGNVMPFVVENKEINPMDDGTCRTIKAQYGQTSTQNLESEGTFGATGAINIVAMRGRENGQQLEMQTDPIKNTITTVQKDNLILEEAIVDDIYNNRDARVYDDYSPSLRAERTGLKAVLIKQATKEGYTPCKVPGVADLNYPSSNTRRGRVQDLGETSPTLTTENVPSVLEPWVWEIDGVLYRIRIRKLTPRECWRLMDFSDEDFEKAQAVNSNTQLYKQAGNSIVRNVLCELFKNILEVV